MAYLWPLFLGALVMIGGGVWQLYAPLDILWARQERYLLARGQSPERTPVWEDSIRRGGIVMVVFGMIALLIPFVIRASALPKMSGVSINGRALTQAEWDGCHHDMPECLSRYAMTSP